MFKRVQPEGNTWIDTVIVAVVSVSAGLFSVFLYPVSGLLAMGGLTLGCYVLFKSKRSPSVYDAASAKWIIMGSSISLSLFIAVGAPSVLTGHIARNETLAVSSMFSISRAEAEFKRISRGRYGSLSELADVSLIDTGLASGVQSGYQFLLRPSPNGFEAFAIPLSYGRISGTGQRSFYTNERGGLHEADKKGGQASEEDELVD
jgi:hypothetical protein